jgi:hypothetical protein
MERSFKSESWKEVSMWVQWKWLVNGNQGSKFFFPARTVRSDNVAAVAFRKIRSHFSHHFYGPRPTKEEG